MKAEEQNLKTELHNDLFIVNCKTEVLLDNKSLRIQTNSTAEQGAA